MIIQLYKYNLIDRFNEQLENKSIHVRKSSFHVHMI